MARIPRIQRGQRPSAVPDSSGLPPATLSGPAADAAEFLAQTTGALARETQAEAEEIRRGLQKKQAILNEVAAGKQAGAFENSILDQAEELKVSFADSPEQAPEEFLRLAREQADAIIEAAPNADVALDVAQRTNVRITAGLRAMHAWAQTRQTQKAIGDIEDRKNQIAVAAGRQGSVGELEVYLDQQKAELTDAFNGVFGAEASAQMRDLEKRAVESFVFVQGDTNPIGVLEALKNPTGRLAELLEPTRRKELLRRTERAVEKRGERRQLDLLHSAAGETFHAVDLLNSGELDAETTVALLRRNDEAIKAARIDRTLTPEQRQKREAFLQRQKKVLEAVDAIRMRTVPFDPARQAVNDVAAIKETEKALRKFKGKNEQLPLIVEQMERLTLAHKTGQISNGGYATAFGHVALAYKKALSEEASNDGFWFFQNSREAGNDQMNDLVEKFGANIPDDDLNSAWVTWMRRYLEATERGTRDVESEEARRIAREAFSLETGLDVR